MWTFKQGESRNVVLQVRENGRIISLVGADLSFTMKKHKNDETRLINKTISDFTVTNAALGEVSFRMTTTDTDQEPGVYIGEFQVEFVSDVSISEDIPIKIIESGFAVAEPEGEGE